MRSAFEICNNDIPDEIKSQIEVPITYGKVITKKIDLTVIKNIEIRKMAYYYFYYFVKRSLNIYKNTYNSFPIFVEYVNKFFKNGTILKYSYNEIKGDFDKKLSKNKTDSFFIGSFYLFCESHHKFVENKPEYEYDVWDIEKLGITIQQSNIKKVRRFDFNNIKSKYYRELEKKYVYNLLKIQCPTTITVKKVYLDYFFEYLYYEKSEPKIEELTRVDIEDYISSLKSQSITTIKLRKLISSLKSFLDYCYDNKDINNLLLNKNDKVRIEREKNPKPLSDFEMMQIRNTIPLLKDRYSDMVFVEMKLGLRPTDLSILKIDDLQIIGDNCFLEYYMPKVNSYNRLALDNITRDVLLKNISFTKALYGEDAKYIFQYNDSPINFTNVITRLNHLFEKNDVKNEHGDIMHITAYRFRYTIATLMGNANFDESEIAKQLGHKNLKNITYYTKMYGSTIKKAINPLLTIVDKLIDLSNDTSSKISINTEKELDINIINGKCSLGAYSSCKKGNACLTCALFRRESKETALACISHEIEMVKTDLSMAEKNDFFQLKDYYIDLLNKLNNKKRIIEEEEDI